MPIERMSKITKPVHEYIDKFNDEINLEIYMRDLPSVVVEIEKQRNKTVIDQIQNLQKQRDRLKKETEEYEQQTKDIRKKLDVYDSAEQDPYEIFLKEQIEDPGLDTKEINEEFVEFIRETFRNGSIGEEELKNYVVASVNATYKVIYSEEFCKKLQIPHYSQSLVAGDRVKPSNDYRLHVANRLGHGVYSNQIDNDTQNEYLDDFQEQFEDYIREDEQYQVDLDSVQDSVDVSHWESRYVELDDDRKKLHIIIFRAVLDMLSGLAEYDMSQVGEDSEEGTVVIGEFVQMNSGDNPTAKPAFGWYF